MDEYKWRFELPYPTDRPACQLTGPEGVDGNVFSIIGRVTATLKQYGWDNDAKAEYTALAKDFRERAMSGKYSYDEILGRLCDVYVETQ